MANDIVNRNVRSARIDRVDTTGDTLTSRAGLSLFARYLQETGVLDALGNHFGKLRGSAKSPPVVEVFKQLFCFLLDGTSRHLCYFDRLQKDAGYAANIESTPDCLLSSHGIKRFLQKLGGKGYQLGFRSLLQELWLWRLRVERPAVVELGLDSMVMDNDEAPARHGVQPTYKKVKGFHPLQLTWGRYLVDGVFRGGSHHCNHGQTAQTMLRKAVSVIRRYDPQVPIVVRLDAGFLDETIFKTCQELGIAFICSGKMYKNIKAFVGQAAASDWHDYANRQQKWDYLDFTDQRGTWKHPWRALYLRPRYEGQQTLLEYARPETILYTNLGHGTEIDEVWHAAGQSHWLEAPRIIQSSHDRGADELVHRAFKDFGFEQLPFERFHPNGAMYYSMVAAFFMFEAFKYDVCDPQQEPKAQLQSVAGCGIKLTAYASTVRRQLLDVAGKIVRTAHNVYLKVTPADWDRLDWGVLWRRCTTPPRICIS